MISNVYRPKRRRGGKLKVARLYRGRFRLDGESSISDVPLHTTEKQVALEKLRAIVRERESERAGVVVPRPLREGAQRSMADHLADWVGELKASRRDAKYVYNVGKRVERLLEECGWVLPRDVTPESFSVWRSRQRGRAPKTLNDYLDVACALLNWMQQQGRIVANPLRGVVRKVSTQGQDAKRRSITDGEVARLFGVAGERRVVYLLALLTGLRRAELDQLQWGDVHLDAPRPFLNVRASTTKNGRSAVVWLRDDLVSALRAVRPVDAGAGALVLPSGVPLMDVFRADLAAAGIPEVDGQGRRVVFHSLRHTLATNLARANVSPRVAQEIMRHSEIGLTMRVYTDATMLPTCDAIDRLPRFDVGPETEAAIATGTDGRVPDDAQMDSQPGIRCGPVVSASVLSVVGAENANRPVVPGESASLSSPVHVGQGVGDDRASRNRTYI